MRLIILEDRNGDRRTVEPGKQIRPARRPGEKIIGVEPDPNLWMTYIFRKCLSCGEMGVYEST